MRWFWILMVGLSAAVPARAEEVLRVGKSAGTVFSYTLLDVGMQQGIFARHGLRIEASAFGGGPRLQQAMAGGNIDIGIDTGPDMVLETKGAPVKVVGALAGRPDELALVVRDAAQVRSVADLKGKRIGVTAAASLTGWLVRQVSLQQGWGPDGIALVGVANGAPSMALLRTGQIDGLAQDILSCLEAQRVGLGHVLLNFGSIEPHFEIQLFFATNDLIAAHPERVRAFLAGWYETIGWVRGHRDATVEIVAKALGQPVDLTAQTYDLLIGNYSSDGRLDPQALTVLSHSFVDLGLADSPPNMSALYTEAFLPIAKQ